MNNIVLIRHGETDMAGRFCGHSDPDLNPAGVCQVICLAEELATLGIEHIYSSDLRRASLTAKAIALRIGTDVHHLPALREIHFGQWEGLDWQEIEDRFSDEANRWLREFPLQSAPGGEAYADFTARIDATFNRFSRQRSQRRSLLSPIAESSVMRSLGSSGSLTTKPGQKLRLTAQRLLLRVQSAIMECRCEFSTFDNP
jgi:alpha-ribazole phosphatase/probable phosphoglycerate mutase